MRGGVSFFPEHIAPSLALLIYAFMVLWLAPCAVQDRRTRHVSNWLTVPLFVAAWPASLVLGTHVLTLAVFIAVYTAYRVRGLGGADGKLAVGMAALTPLGLLVSLVVSGLTFLFLRWKRSETAQGKVAIPGALLFYAGTVIATYYLIAATALPVPIGVGA